MLRWRSGPRSEHHINNNMDKNGIAAFSAMMKVAIAYRNVNRIDITFSSGGLAQHASYQFDLITQVLVPSVASALRTLAWEIPNWRAIRQGVTTALNAARTALI
jgi:hypothetical protein